MFDDLAAGAMSALEDLRRVVSDGAARADGRLPSERELARRTGHDVRAIRRALDVLETEGLVWRRRGRDAHVSPPAGHAAAGAAMAETAELDDVMEARLMLEPVIAGLAARRAGPHDVHRMRALAQRAHSASDSGAREIWDAALHRLIAQTAGNPMLLAMIELVNRVRASERWRRVRANVLARLSDDATLAAQHDAIIDAIAAADADAAEAAMRAHVRMLTRRMDLARAAEIDALRAAAAGAGAQDGDGGTRAEGGGDARSTSSHEHGAEA